MNDHRRLRWGILGTARIADGGVIPAIRASRNAQVQAIASRDLARAKVVAAKHEIAQAYGSYQELLDDPAIEAVYIPLPTPLHAPWALRALEHGKAVLVEKPFALDAEEAARVVTAAAQRHLVVGEAFMYRFHPMTRRMIELVRSGAVGRPRLVRSSFTVDIKERSDIRWQADTGGGALRDLGCYCVGISRALLDEEPTAVAALAEWTPEVDASFAGSMRFPSGALASFVCSLQATFECSYEVIGSEGRLRVDQGGMVAWPGGAFTIACQRGDERHEESIVPVNHYQLMVESFADSVLTGTPYGIPVEDTLANLRVMDRLLACSVQPARDAQLPSVAGARSAVSQR
jgi:xylose dehydrogenase (NAD/NADP)